MKVKIISPEKTVKRFLKELKEVISDPKFNPKTDLEILPKKKDELPTDPFTTANTMLALGYDETDLVSELMALNTSEYLETFIDNKYPTEPPFFAFGKSVKSKDVYIKVKIRDRLNCKVFCVSFHFQRYPLGTRPYE